MKNSFKMTMLAFAAVISFAACKGKGAASADSTKTDSAKEDIVKKDTTKKPDSIMRETFDAKTGKKTGTIYMAAPKDTTKK